MTQVIETEPLTLFDVAPDGNIVMPNTWPGHQGEFSAREWQRGSERLLDQGERAMAEVAPNSVDIAERAGQLTMTLDAISERNQQTHAARKRGLDRNVALALEKQAAASEHRARYGFFAANGLGHLATAGIEVEVELTAEEKIARRVMDGRFTTFLNEYGGTGVAVREKRETLKQQLATQLTQRADTNG